MNILWITNILLPEANSLLNGDKVLKGSGGWLIGAASELLKNDSISLSIAAPSPLVSKMKVILGKQITYYAFPKTYRKDKQRAKLIWKEIHDRVQPDVVHIHGTEFPYGLDYIKTCGARNVVASIQGMTSVFSKFFICDIPITSILRYTSIFEVLLHQSLLHGKNNLFELGQSEIQLIKNINHVIGRTTWDKSHTWAINTDIRYHFCNETLRPEFYSGQWSPANCKQHTIFISQPKNSLKGFHQLLKALPYVLKKYPDTVVRIPGSIQLYPSSVKGKISQTGYDKYLRQLITENHLRNHLFFLGPLSAEEMKKEYLCANVFVSCSSIENSSNSIGEAQILGTPCISSFVGGSDDLIINEKTGWLYRFEEIEMLAYYICRVFSGEVDLTELSKNEVSVAKQRHDPITNMNTLLNIYDIVAHDER